MPDWRIEFVIGLDNREARARYVRPVPKRLYETASERRLSNAERPGR